MYDTILDVIGGTPLVRLPRLEREWGARARVALKLEFLSPGGSVKDRIGAAMIARAEADGLARPGETVLVEPTSGNTGIALAMVAASRGYRLIVVMPEGASVERRKLMLLLGAELELTPAREGMRGAIARAEAIVAGMPGAWMPRQFDNPANPEAHARGTAEEIWTDTDGQVDLVVAGAGTGGTVTGIGRTLRPRKPGFQVFAVEPAESAVLGGDEAGQHGIQGIGPGFVPRVLDRSGLDGVLAVTEREAIATARLCARLEGIAVGISSGAALAAASRLAVDPVHDGKLIVAIAPSFAERYFSTSLFTGLL